MSDAQVQKNCYLNHDTFTKEQKPEAEVQDFTPWK